MRKTILLFYFGFLTSTLFTQNVFDFGVRQIEIYFSQTNWQDSLHLYFSNNSSQRLIADSILIDGVADQNVGIRFRDNSSYSSSSNKNSLNIKLDYVNNGQSINGYNTLKLSNGYSDPTFIREILAYEIASLYMPAPKATYANVFVNGNLLGLYTCVQSIDNDFTNEQFYERKGPFFKVENTSTSVTGCSSQNGVLNYYSDTLCYQMGYQMLSANDWSQLGNFLDTLNNYFIEIEKVMDIDRALWMMAFQNLTTSLDGPINSLAKNFYLFKDNNGRFSPILYDMSKSFGVYTNGLSNPISNVDLQELDIYHNLLDQNNSLTSKIFANNRYKKMYVAHMKTIINEHFSNNNYISRGITLQSLIDNYITSDPNLFHNYADFISNLNNTVSNIIGIEELMNSRISYLQNLPEFSLSPPEINNISSNPTNVSPHSTVNITAEINNSNYVYLAYRFKFADKFEKALMYDDGNYGDGIAGDGIYGVSIDVDARDIQYYIYAENSDAGIFSPQRAEKEFHQIPVVGGLVINEIMASNILAIADQDGEFDDWVELYNGNNFDLNLNGYYLSDSENNLTKWSFPNVTIGANDYMIIWCDTAGTTQTGIHTNYRLSADQEEVYLSDPTGVVIDAVHFVNMPIDKAYARIPNGTGVMTYQTHTYDAPNQILSYLGDIKYENDIRIYPNPTKTKVYILGNFEVVSLYNAMGQKILEKKETNSLDISWLEDGIYFLKINDTNFKILKQ